MSKSLYDILIMGIKQRPALYTGDNSIHSLKIFVEGYILALKINNIPDVLDTFKEFTEWLSIKFKKQAYVKGWDTILLEECNMDNEKAINLFFELLEYYFKKS